jgi:hypothetical protein
LNEQKLPNLEYVFFTVPENKTWLMTRRGHIINQHYELRWMTFMTGFLLPIGLFLIGLLWMIFFDSEGRGFTVLNSAVCLLIPCLVLLLVYPVRQHYRLRRLEKSGELIIGRVQAFDNPLTQGRFHEVSRDLFHGRIAIMTYRFETPSGEVVVARRKYNPGKWMLPRDPQVGERLAIFYISPQLHEPL